MSFREMTPDDLREWSQASPIGMLEFFPAGEEPPPDKIELSGRRVAIRLRVMPRWGEPLAVGDLLIVEVIAAPRMSGICRVCECTEEAACPSGCYWVEPDLCSSCAPRAHPNLKLEDARVGGVIQVTSEEQLQAQLKQAREVGRLFRGLVEEK